MTGGDDTELETLRRALARERAARREAETIAERATRELYDALRSAEDANAELEAFLYTASHDLRTPIITLAGYVDLLQETPGLHEDPEVAQYLDRMGFNADYAQQLLDDLLEVSRVGRRDTEPARVVLRPLIDAIGSSVGDRSPGFSVVVDGALPDLWLNPLRTHQLFTNLIENSAKYGGPGVTVTVRSVDRGALGTRLLVADDGPGVPGPDRERVFELFERLDREDGRGTGVGLAICRKFVLSVGGDIAMEEAPAGGAQVRIDLPPEAVAPPVS